MVVTKKREGITMTTRQVMVRTENTAGVAWLENDMFDIVQDELEKHDE